MDIKRIVELRELINTIITSTILKIILRFRL